jgi:hypothetical protein
VSVPGSELVPADSPARTPITWPASFIFPLHGVIAVNAHVDRQGNIRDVAFVISKNQGLHAELRRQIKDWKFKPYLIDGAPVEVVTTLEIPFHLKYEPLGANGKQFPEIPFGERIKQYHAKQDLRAAGRRPLRLRESFTLNGGPSGRYEETWKSPEEWSRKVKVQSATLEEKRAAGATKTDFHGPEKWGPEMRSVLLAMEGRLPELRTFQEQDWGNSAVAASNVNPSAGADASEPVLIRPARGGVDANNHPTSGQAYWFDADGLLTASYGGGMTAVNSNFEVWNGVNVPRRVEVFTGASPTTVVTVDSIEEK